MADLTGRIILQREGDAVRVAEKFKAAVEDALQRPGSDVEIAGVDVGSGGSGGSTVRTAPITFDQFVGDFPGKAAITRRRELSVDVEGGDPGGHAIRRENAITFIGGVDEGLLDSAIEKSIDEGRKVFFVTGSMSHHVLCSVARHLPEDVLVVEVDV